MSTLIDHPEVLAWRDCGEPVRYQPSFWRPRRKSDTHIVTALFGLVLVYTLVMRAGGTPLLCAVCAAAGALVGWLGGYFLLRPLVLDYAERKAASRYEEWWRANREGEPQPPRSGTQQTPLERPPD
jgi:hypothetical protein